MLKIYGHSGSINVRKVLWACEEMNLAVEQENWGGSFRPTSDPAFKALNPFGLIPVIEHDGLKVRESNTILRYLAATCERSDLLPTEPGRRAEVEAWMDWQASDFNNSWRPAFMGLVRNHPDYQDENAIRQSATTFNRMVGLVDDALHETGAFLCGSEFTLADIVVGLSIHRWKSTPITRPDYGHVEVYYSRLCERPGFRRYGRDGGP